MTESPCVQIFGNHVNGDGFLLYDSKDNGKTIALCSVHPDPHWSEWNMGWPCPHAKLQWSRGGDGKRVHLSGCHYERESWSWAADKTLLELVEMAPKYEWKFCKRCIPTVNSAERLLDAKADTNVPTPRKEEL